MEAIVMEATSIVLAGGKSLRLGRDKVREKLGEESLLQRILHRLRPLGGELLVVMSEQKANPLPLESHFPVRIVTDVYPGRWALGGLYSGLLASTTQYNLVVGCDMPFLNLELLRYLLKIADGFDAVVPRLGKFLEPLHAVYSKSCLATIEPMVKKGRYPIYEFYPKVTIRYVEAAEIDRIDPRHLSFFNINTDADLRRALSLAQQGL